MKREVKPQMSDLLYNTELSAEYDNPLLGIDTSFRSYLNAYTRSFSNHVVGGALDYALDSDFAVRQKIQSLSAWGKLSKSINTTDITTEAKYLFSKCNQAGMLKFPEVYDIVRKCADRLELSLPIVFVREDVDKMMIYSIASDIIEPCIVISSALIDNASAEELQLLIGAECGRIQNNHSLFNFGCSYISNSPNKFKPVERSFNQPVGNQVICALSEWIDFADITADRAAVICCDDPQEFGRIFADILKGGFVDFYGRKQEDVSINSAVNYWESIRNLPSRNIKCDEELTKAERRIAAAMEFARCDGLYKWRTDLKPADGNRISIQDCNIRSNIIMGTAVL